MKKSVKILVTIGAIFLYIIIATPIMGALKDTGHSTGFIGLILLVALIGAIKAIWKQPDDDNDGNDRNNNDSPILQE